MTFLGVDLFAALRQRLGAVLAAFAGSAACCVFGALMALVFAPRRALQAGRVSRLPVMDAAAVDAAAEGDAILITGVLVCSMILSPILLVGGLLGAIFWRRR